MNWILLIIAGLFEVVFAFCLGKAKLSAGNEMYMWYAAFLVALAISMVLLVKATQTLPIWHCLCSMDRHWSSWHCSDWNSGV